MSAGDFLGLLVLITGIVLVLAIVGSAYKRRLAFQQRKLELIADRGADKAAQSAVQWGEFEQRLRVIERIVTDKGYDVATQIEALRDARAVEAGLAEGAR